MPLNYVGGQPGLLGEGPFLDRVEFQFIKEGTVALQNLQGGQVHWTDNIPPQQIEGLGGDGTLVLESVPSTDYWYFAANQARKPFDDPKVRQALAYAVDRESIVAAAKFSAATVNQAAIPDGATFYTDYHNGDVRAVDGVSLKVRRGETFGVVGESGCGKSTTGLALLGLEKATGGSVQFDGVNVLSASKSELRGLRRRMAMIFQDFVCVAEPTAHDRRQPSPSRWRSTGCTRAAPIGVPASTSCSRWSVSTPNTGPAVPTSSPAASGSASASCALATEPDFIVCDEPIAPLDVSIQAQILNLLRRLQSDLGLTLLFIAHDLSAVQHIADRIAVMYLGRVVEVADAVSIGVDPKHPYTRALLSAVPIPDTKRERQRKRILLEGELPSSLHPPTGCNFRTRCPDRFKPCPDIDPTLQEADGHLVACHLHGVVGLPVDARVGSRRSRFLLRASVTSVGYRLGARDAGKG